ncbi:chorismate mutase [Reichenbachiella sp.]|uniref:chorismate mutase n=1 Tax=Reichenbachiella sp. TaxID=2184521 RepID=UPI003B5B029A
MTVQNLCLDNLRSALIRQEETIIFALIERAQFKLNPIIYRRHGIPIHGFNGSFSDYLLWETEKIHAKVRRYTSPDEHPFFDALPEPILPPLDYQNTINVSFLNINDKIHEMYQKHIVPEICEEGDDENYGSSATCDVVCLQALSKRIHYGKFVAEVKFQKNPKMFSALISSANRPGLLDKITNKEVEKKLLRRVEQKAAAYGRDIDVDTDEFGYKIAPQTVRNLYEKWVIPLTKEVEIEYLLMRLT